MLPTRRRAAARILAGLGWWLGPVCAGAGLLLSVQAIADTAAKTNYMLYCSGCHRANGAGSHRGGVPDLRGYVGSFGRTEDGRVYLMHVPGIIESDLDDSELAGAMNYVFKRWGDAPADDPVPPFTEDEVKRLRAEPVPDVVKKRRAVAKELKARGLPVAAYPWE